MFSSRFRRHVPGPLHDLKRKHRLAAPNQWLGSAEHAVHGNSDAIKRQAKALAQQMLPSSGAEKAKTTATPRRQPAANR